jgi:tetratricopeptide (TPR) repeat protein
MDDIFAIQDEIAFAITEKLKVTLFESEKQHIYSRPTQNKEAYELYLKGRFYLNRRGNDIIRALGYLEQAITMDAEFALAHAGYADACLLAGFWGLLPSKEVMPKAKHAIETSLRLNPLLSEPYTTLGYYHASFEWNWKEAKKNYLHAIALNPQNPQTYFWYAIYLAWVEKNYDEASNYTTLAIQLEPLSAVAYSMHATVAFAAKRFDEQLAAAKMAFELDSMSFFANRAIGYGNLCMKKFTEAIECFQNALQISNRFQWAITDLIYAFTENGNFDKAEALMKELDTRSVTEYIAHGYRGLAAAWLGDLDLAMEYLEIAYQNRDPILMCINIPYTPDSLRNDSRFQELLEKIGLTQ